MPWVAGFQYRAHGSVPRMVKAAGGAIWSPYFGDVDSQRVIEARSDDMRAFVEEAAGISRYKERRRRVCGIGLVTAHRQLRRGLFHARLHHHLCPLRTPESAAPPIEQQTSAPQSVPARADGS